MPCCNIPAKSREQNKREGKSGPDSLVWWLRSSVPPDITEGGSTDYESSHFVFGIAARLPAGNNGMSLTCGSNLCHKRGSESSAVCMQLGLRQWLQIGVVACPEMADYWTSQP